jgi:hypothetical protein
MAGQRPIKIAWRFSKSALFLSASALCLAPLSGAGRAGPLDNTPFVSMYGGFLFNESDSSVDFTGDGSDTFLNALGQLDPGDDGVQVGVAIGAPLRSPAWDWQATLNGAFFEDDNSSFVATAPDTGGGSATNSFHYQYLDLELGYRPGVVPDGGLRLFAGPRLLHAATDLDYEVDVTLGGGGGKLGTYERVVDLWGMGARAGAEAAMPLGSSRASLSLLGAGSAIYARSDTDYSFDFVGTSSNAGSTSDKDEHGVYSVEARAALNFAATDRIDLQLGYQVQHWWDLTTTFADVESADTAITDVGHGDVLTHGPFARITVKLGPQSQ